MSGPVSSPFGADGGALPVSPLPAGVTTALWSWLQGQRHASGSARTSALAARPEETRRAMRLLCEEAHRHGVRVEQLVVLLKQLWAAAPADTTSDNRLSSRDVFDDIVRVCIEEFYGALRPGGGQPASGGDAAGGRADSLARDA